MAIKYRPGEPSDVPFVIDSWCDSYRTAYTAGIIQMDDWADIMRDQLRKLLLRKGVDLAVVENPDAAEGVADVHGWMVYEKPGFAILQQVQEWKRWTNRRGREREGWTWVKKFQPSEVPLVHFVYVKEHYRRHGLMRGLFKAAEVDPIEPFFYTCKTPVVTRLTGKFPGGQWNPLIARNARSQREYESDPSQVHQVQ